MAHSFGLFVAKYLDDTMNQARLADALGKDEAYVSRMLNKGQYIKSHEKGRHTILTVVQTLHNHHGTLTLDEVNELLLELGKAPLNPSDDREALLIGSLGSADVAEHQPELPPQPDSPPMTESQPDKFHFLSQQWTIVAITVFLLLLLAGVGFIVLGQDSTPNETTSDALIRQSDTPQLVGVDASRPQSFIQAYELLGGYDLLGDPIIDETNGTVQKMTVCGKRLEIQFFEGCAWCRPFALVWHDELDNVITIHGSILTTFLDADVRESQLCLPVATQSPSLHEAPFRTQYGREGFYQTFEQGTAFVTSMDGWRTHVVPSAVYERFVGAGGLDGTYGFPIGPFIEDFQRFENGTISLSQSYAEAEWVEQSPSPVQVTHGQSATVSVRLRNMGNEVWDTRYTLRVQEPTYDAEKFACDDWDSPTIAATLDTRVEPGEIGTFSFSLCPVATLEVGEYTPNWILFRNEAPVPNYRNGNADNVTTAWWEVVVNNN
jgi:hypothetical protein